MLIKSISEWQSLAKDLAEHGYTLWQWQFDVDSHGGFRARFYCPGKQDIDVMTFDKAVKTAILKYRA
jgi:hypothetical protein